MADQNITLSPNGDLVVSQPSAASLAGTHIDLAAIQARLTKYDLGGGVFVYTSMPGAISMFGWDTGSTSGFVTNIMAAAKVVTPPAA